MKIGPTAAELYEIMTKWRRWFAWYPIRTAELGTRWLEFVERSYVLESDGWDRDYWHRVYRLPEDAK